VDIAAIGIVADQMPLIGINRSIVVEGLKKLSHTDNLGLREMLKNSKIEGKKINTYHINFVLAPRINAVGRIDDPMQALRLLCSSDVKSLKKIAINMETHNSRRQLITDQAVSKALRDKSTHNLVIATSEDFHEGVIGLVAGKLVESHTKPAIAISIGKGKSKGSARSLPGINITEILRSQSKYLLSVGGHEMAGGFSLETKDIPKFTKDIYRYADKHISKDLLVPTLQANGELTLNQTTLTLARLITSLEPFGTGNYKPKFLVRDCQVLEDRILGRDGSHRKLVIEQGGITRTVTWFNAAKTASDKLPAQLSHISQMIFTIEINHWNNKDYLQLNAQYVEST